MENNIGIIGLGYVGLPLAVEFGKKHKTIGFDIDKSRINKLKNYIDETFELDKNQIKESVNLVFSDNIDDLRACNFYIITVPTPIDKYNSPNLKPLLNATKMTAQLLSKGDIVIYESTVYPGCTEEECVPILEKESGLVFNKDFYCGYSPERINPGDKLNTLTNIVKVTSGSCKKTAKIVDDLYSEIIDAGTYLASSIKVAEASKAIENAQRDINISFVNELALIFEKMNIDTLDVIEAAGTKWNFLKYKPGLVGGHCIGVDPYYLAFKSESLGYYPEVILSGRKINDNMALFVSQKLVKLLLKKDIELKNSNVLILGFTFKENRPDTRNTKVIDIVKSLNQYKINVSVYDPYANFDNVKKEYGIELISKLDLKYDGIILAVAHDEFKKINFKNLTKQNNVIIDLKGLINREYVDYRL